MALWTRLLTGSRLALTMTLIWESLVTRLMLVSRLLSILTTDAVFVVVVSVFVEQGGRGW